MRSTNVFVSLYVLLITAFDALDLVSAGGQVTVNGYTVGWQASSTPSAVDFTFTCTPKSSNNFWTAFAFSYDQGMGNDGVILCEIVANQGLVQQAYNPGSYSSTRLLSNPTAGISNTNVTLSNGVLNCAFTRLIANTAVDNFFNLNNTYYLLVAQGSTSSQSSISQHSEKYISGSMINFQTYVNVSGTGTFDSAKVKTHGALMAIAWMFCASNGIMFARYYKFIFPTIRWFNLHFWFNMHRPLMIFVPICSIVAFIVILADAGWQWVPQTYMVAFVHSIFGMVTIGLSVIQIPMAFLRPAPDSPKRPIFNFAHKSVGMLAFLLSLVSLFTACFTTRIALSAGGWAIMTAWTVWCVIAPLANEFIQFFFVKQDATYSIGDRGDIKLQKSNKMQKRIEVCKSIVLVFHVLVSLGLTIGLIIVVASAT